jgi:hypothetical protein
MILYKIKSKGSVSGEILTTRDMLMRELRHNVKWFLEDSVQEFAHFQFWHQLAGRFWKNPDVIADPYFIPKVLQRMPI